MEFHKIDEYLLDLGQHAALGEPQLVVTLQTHAAILIYVVLKSRIRLKSEQVRDEIEAREFPE